MTQTTTQAKTAQPTQAATIAMRAITKVFATDEMETHALRGIDLDINTGDFVSINLSSVSVTSFESK